MSKRVAIIGAGFGGIGMAARLTRDDVQDVTLIEASGGVGGTWRHNTYPGAGCDVPSHLYSFSFFPKPDWPRAYARQPDILRYLEECVRAFGLEPKLRLNTEVTAATWDEAAAQWRLDLSTGETLSADVLVSAVGQLNRPHYPELPGLDDFAGPAFHSARWDHEVELAGKRLGVIGTGASAIQFVPEVAEPAAHTTVFQRSAAYTIPKKDRAYSPLEQQLYRRVPGLLAASRGRQYLTHEARAIGFVSVPGLMQGVQKTWRKRMEEAVADPALRERLTPDYVVGCKRILLTNDWYDVLQRPDVSLVSDGIAAVEPEGVRTRDGRLHACDVLIYGTGFRTLDLLTPMRVTGRNGRDLHTEWADHARAYRGLSVPGFPNFFVLYGPQTNLGHSSIVYMLESQMAHVQQAVAALDTYGLDWLEVRPRAHEQWDRRVREMSRGTVWESGCRSWYLTPDGRNVNNWPGYTFAYRRAAGRLDLADYATGVGLR